MIRLFVQDASFWWAIALVVGTPAAILVLGEAIARLGRLGHPLANTLTGVRNIFVPIAAVYLMVRYVAEVEGDSVFVRVLLTLLAVSVLNTVLSLFNVLLFATAAHTTWQARTPKLVREVARFALVVVGSGFALSSVWHIDLGSLVAALGVGSIVLGLALQEPLGNLFSGLMLTFERPFEVGDWIQVGDKAGEVVEINWRAVHILTSSKELQVIPNSSLAKNNFGNYSRPTRHFADTLELSFSAAEAPNRVKAMLLEVLAGTPGVLLDPAPSVRTASHSTTAIVYKVGFHVADYRELGGVRDEVLTRLWYAARREGLTDLPPAQASIQLTKEEAEAPANRSLEDDLLRPFRQFGLAEVEEVAKQLRRRAVKRYARGERVMVEGEPFAGLYLVLNGEAALTVRDGSGEEPGIAQVTRGDFFGEKSLLSCHTSDVTVTAVSDLEVLVLDSDQLHALLERTPRLAREIGQVMEARRQASQRVRGGRGVVRLAC